MEFATTEHCPLTRLVGTTPRAVAWLEFHGLESVMRRADAIADGVRTLPDVLQQLLVEDLGALA